MEAYGRLQTPQNVVKI